MTKLKVGSDFGKYAPELVIVNKLFCQEAAWNKDRTTPMHMIIDRYESAFTANND